MPALLRSNGNAVNVDSLHPRARSLFTAPGAVEAVENCLFASLQAPPFDIYLPFLSLSVCNKLYQGRAVQILALDSLKDHKSSLLNPLHAAKNRAPQAFSSLAIPAQTPTTVAEGLACGPHRLNRTSCSPATAG